MYTYTCDVSSLLIKYLQKFCSDIMYRFLRKVNPAVLPSIDFTEVIFFLNFIND